MNTKCPRCVVRPCVCPPGGRVRVIALTDLARAELQLERDQKARARAMRALFGPWPTCAEACG